MANRASEERPCSQIVEASEVEIPNHKMERQSFVPQQGPQPRWVGGSTKKSRTSIFNKVMAIVNLALGIILATSIGLIAHESSRACSKSVTQLVQPYSPALEAVIPVIKKFKPESIFQEETSDAIEIAWTGVEGPHSGIVALNGEETAKLAKTNHGSIALPSDPDKHLYGVSMYQQLRCLNTIRKSFYRESFYPALSDEKFQYQKNECFDFLRQAIQCHGDVSLTYFSNKSHTTKAHSDFENPELVARSKGASMFWDVEHSCRALESIEAWVAEHQLSRRHGMDF